MANSNDSSKPRNPPGNPQFQSQFKCGRRRKNCPKCQHKYLKTEYDLEACPDCGETRWCAQRVMEEGLACRNHGGASLRGVAAPGFRTGTASKYLRFLPKRYEQIIGQLNEDDVLDLTEMIVVMKARFADVLSRTDRGESEELIKKAIRYCDELDEAQVKAAQANREGRDKDEAHWANVAAQAWSNIKVALKQNLSDWQTWNEAITVAVKTTRVVESQRRRLVEERLMMGIDQVQRMFFAMAEAVNRHVDDTGVLGKIQEDFKNIALAGLAQGGAMVIDESVIDGTGSET